MGRDRSLLVELLATVDPVLAEGRTDALLDRFASLSAVLSADPAVLRRLLGDNAAAAALTLVRRIMLRALEHEALEGPVFPSSAALVDYLHVLLAHRPSEQVRALFLDAGHRLLKEELICLGTIDEAPLYRREIVRRALDLNAAGLILVHNHPSGDPEPSDFDLAVTRDVARLMGQIGVILHDHLIVSRAGWRSIRRGPCMT